MYTGFLDLGTRKLNPFLGEVDDCKVLGPLGQKHTVSFLEDLQVETWFLRSISMYCMEQCMFLILGSSAKGRFHDKLRKQRCCN